MVAVTVPLFPFILLKDIYSLSDLLITSIEILTCHLNLSNSKMKVTYLPFC